MTIYILYHNKRDDVIPQWNYIPDPTIMPKWVGDGTQFDLDIVESLINSDVEYARLDQLPAGSKWIYVLHNYYDNIVYERHGLDVLDHFLSIPRLVDDLLLGHGRILFDDRREGYLYTNYISGQLGQFFSNKNIPLDCVIFATGTSNVSEIFKTNKYKFKPLYVRQFELEACRLANTLTYKIDRAPVKRFLCLNRRYAYRLHRLQLLALIHQKKLLPHFYYSMLDGVDNISVLDAAKTLIGNEPAHFNTYNTMLTLADKFPMLLDTDDLINNLAITQYSNSLVPLYNSTAISVVVETLFNDVEVFFSEKVWHPIRMQQPFILVNGAGSLQHLHELGYKTFNHWWDESYDSIADPYDRMEAIVSVINDIAKWSDFKLSVFMQESTVICEHNLKHLMSADTRMTYNPQLHDIFYN